MDRPRVVTYNMASVDGRLTIAPDVLLMAGDDRWTAIAGDAEAAYDWVRGTHDPDVLLEGSGSFVTADARPPDAPATGGESPSLHDHFLPEEVVSEPGRRWMAVVDGRGRVRLQFTEWPDPDWAGWHALMIVCRSTPAPHLSWLREHGIPYVVAGDGPDGHVDLETALSILHGVLGVGTLVSTGGGRLNGALLRAGLVDEVDVDLLPAVIGGRGTPALFDAPPLLPDEEPTPLRLSSVEVVGDGHVRLRYSVEG